MAKKNTTNNAPEAKKRGRPSLTPQFVEQITSTPKGTPVVVKVARSYSLAHHHKNRLRAAGIEATIVSPKAEREIGTGFVKNDSDSFAVVAAATGHARRKGDREIHKVVIA